jgi:predicted RNA-binding protein
VTKQETINKAIEKTMANGWEPVFDFGNQEEKAESWKVDGDEIIWKVKTKLGNTFDFKENYLQLIYNHHFAKALWGEDRIFTVTYEVMNGVDFDNHPTYRSVTTGIKTWQYHLQQMVIADDPIKYLGENI